MWIASLPLWALAALSSLFGFACFGAAANLMGDGQAKAGWLSALYCVLSFLTAAASGVLAATVWRL